METRLALALRQYGADTAQAFGRAPVECLLAVFVAVVFSYSVENPEVGVEAVHTAFAAVMIALIAWGGTLLHALRVLSDRQRIGVTMAGAAVGITWLLATPDFERASEGFRVAMLLAGIVLLVLTAPAAAATRQNLHLRRVDSRMLLRTIGIGLYGLALFAGLAGAIAAVDNLFELDLQGSLYAHVFVWIMVVLVPWVVAGGLDDYVRPLDEQSDVTRVVHRLATFLVPPLVALYFVILCVYVVRILLTGELPQNLASPMVIIAGLLSALALIIFDPDPDSGFGMRWLRFTPIVFIALVPLGLWALAVRIGDYGWTEFRLLRVLIILVLLALALLAVRPLFRRRPLPLRWIPLGLGVALLLGAVGPWSITAVSRRDQQQRLATALDAAGIDVTRPVALSDTATRTVPGDVYRQIEGSATYLQSHFGPDAVTAVAPHVPATLEGGYALTAYYHLRSADPVPRPDRTLFGRMPEGVPVNTTDGAAYRIEVHGRTPNERAGIMRDTLVFFAAADTIRVDLGAAISGMRAGTAIDEPKRSALPLDRVALRAFDARGEDRGTLLVLELFVDEKGEVVRLDAVLTLRRAP